MQWRLAHAGPLVNIGGGAFERRFCRRPFSERGYDAVEAG
jgi:hypothetical protein